MVTYALNGETSANIGAGWGGRAVMRSPAAELIAVSEFIRVRIPSPPFYNQVPEFLSRLGLELTTHMQGFKIVRQGYTANSKLE